MAVIGLSKPYYATYTASDGTVTYGTPAVLAKAVNAEIQLDDADQVVLYADNAAAETASGFTGGTLSLTVDELSIATAGALLGITPGSSSTPAGTTLTLKAGQLVPYVGVGMIVKKQVNNTPKWMGIVLYKVQFRVPDVVAATQEETVTFQTPELEAKILRDDTADAKWSAWGEFATEADALTWITGQLS